MLAYPGGDTLAESTRKYQTICVRERRRRERERREMEGGKEGEGGREGVREEGWEGGREGEREREPAH